MFGLKIQVPIVSSLPGPHFCSFNSLIVTHSGQRSQLEPGHRCLSNSEVDVIKRLGMKGGVEMASRTKGKSKLDQEIITSSN